MQKKEIEQFTQSLSSTDNLTTHEFSFGKRFVLRTLLLLAGETPSFRKDGRYEAESLAAAEEIFLDNRFEDAIVDGFTIAAELGFHNAALSSKTVVLPVIQFLYETDDYDIETHRDDIHYWLATAVLNRVFGIIGSQRVLETASEQIRESVGEFPADGILDELSGGGAETTLTTDDLDRLLQEIDYQSGSRRNTLLTHLYESRRAGHNAYEGDHIFPRNKLTDGAFLTEHGVDPEQVDSYAAHRDHIANLQLLGSRGENQAKGDRDLTEWLQSIDEGELTLESADGSSDTEVGSLDAYFEQHYIPDESTLHEYESFLSFLTSPQGRLNLMRDRLQETLPIRQNTDS